MGTVLGDMRANIGKWKVEVPATSANMPDESLVVGMMDALIASGSARCPWFDRDEPDA